VLEGEKFGRDETMEVVVVFLAEDMREKIKGNVMCKFR
jgi:hypothetical protein